MVISRLTELFSSDSNGSASNSNHNSTTTQVKSQDSDNSSSCYFCRFVGGGGLTALGLYVLATANGILPQANNIGTGGITERSRRLFTKEAGPRNIAANVLGCVVITIGFARMLDYQLPANKKD